MRTGVLFFSRENDMVPLSAGVVRTDLGIVPTFWDIKNIICETINLLRETMHTDETSCNVFSMTKYLSG